MKRLTISKEAYQLLTNHAKTLGVDPNHLANAVLEYALENPELIQKIIRRLKELKNET